MTPAQQRLIDAAAKKVFDLDCAKSKIAPWLQWSEATEAERNEYRARVTIPVTVALKEAAKIAKTAWLTTPHGSIADADAMNDMCEDLSAAISSLIPAQENLK
jgi:hypothetical protein